MVLNRSIKLDKRVRYVIAGLVGLAFLFELIRDCQRDGDFMGYVHAGNAVLNGTNIYADYLNTWPPFFSIFSVPIAIAHNMSPVFTRLLWLVGILIAWFGIIRISANFTYNKGLQLWKKSGSSLSLIDWKILLPFLFVLRFIIDDLSNIQINSYLLLCSLVVVSLHHKGKDIRAGALLGLIISLKVYPIFILLFFLWKRKFRLVGVAVVTIFMTVLASFVVFGVEQAQFFINDWLTNKAMGETILTHKNQSIFPLLEGLFSEQSRGLDIYYNLLDVDHHVAKKLSYVVVGILALIPAFLLRYRTRDRNSPVPFGQLAFVFAAIPMVSPLAWKYYFVFLFPLYLVLFNQLFVIKGHGRWSKYLFIASLSLSILSTDGLLGVWFSDVLEVFGAITIATLLLLFVYIRIYRKSLPNRV